jgi:hypothetical protein
MPSLMQMMAFAKKSGEKSLQPVCFPVLTRSKSFKSLSESFSVAKGEKMCVKKVQKEDEEEDRHDA